MYKIKIFNCFWEENYIKVQSSLQAKTNHGKNKNQSLFTGGIYSEVVFKIKTVNCGKNFLLSILAKRPFFGA